MEKSLVCDKCEFKTHRKTDWNKHLKTQKHILRSGGTCANCILCPCNKIFKHRQSLARHQKTCVPFLESQNNQSTEDNICYEISETTPENTETSITLMDDDNPPEEISKELLFRLLKQNENIQKLMMNQFEILKKQQTDMSECQTQMTEVRKTQSQIMEYCKQPKTVKNKFNLNFFLNVQCKDALNITDFMRNITISLTDLEHVGKNGYVEGVSRIIINALSELDLYKRPIHCTDVKREVLFVKDEDKWEKDENGVKVNKVIGHVAQKNCQTLCRFMTPNTMSTENPDYEKNLRMMRNINGGGATRNHEKIISLISQKVILGEEQNRILL